MHTNLSKNYQKYKIRIHGSFVSLYVGLVMALPQFHSYTMRSVTLTLMLYCNLYIKVPAALYYDSHLSVGTIVTQRWTSISHNLHHHFHLWSVILHTWSSHVVLPIYDRSKWIFRQGCSLWSTLDNYLTNNFTEKKHLFHRPKHSQKKNCIIFGLFEVTCLNFENIVGIFVSEWNSSNQQLISLPNLISAVSLAQLLEAMFHIQRYVKLMCYLIEGPLYIV